MDFIYFLIYLLIWCAIVVRNFLGNNRAYNFFIQVENMLYSFRRFGSKILFYEVIW